MSIVKPSSRRRALDSNRVPRLVLLLLALAGPWGVAAQTPPAGRPTGPDQNTPRAVPPLPPLTTSSAASDEKPETDPMDDLESKEPADGKWIKTDDGREYFVTRLKKAKGTVFRSSERVIIYKRLYRFELDHEDAEYWYIRYYRASIEGEKSIEETQQAQQERLEAVKASYRFDERTVDRLIFAAYDQGLPRKGQWRQGLEVADMNGDGHLDIAHGPPRKGEVAPHIYLGDSAGSWRLWTGVRWPNVALDYGDIAVGDIDGDGLLDLALGVHLKGVKVFRQSAPGQFVDWSKGLPFSQPGRGGDATGFASRAVELVDWNGDGKLDLLALGEGPRQQRTEDGKTEGLPVSATYGLAVYLNPGDQGWLPLAAGQTGGAFGDSIAVGNWNDDQRPDVVTASYSWGNRDVLQVNSGRTDVAAMVSALPSLRASAWVFGVAAGDFDGDRREDVVTSFATYDGEMARRGLELSRVNADGAWRTELIAAYEGKDNMWSLASGDLDGDGHQDLVATTERGKVKVYLGDGSGGFAVEESPELDPPDLCRGYGLELADIDGDGRAEIVAGFAGETEAMLEFLGQTRCESTGALRAWRASPRSAS